MSATKSKPKSRRVPRVDPESEKIISDLHDPLLDVGLNAVEKVLLEQGLDDLRMGLEPSYAEGLWKKDFVRRPVGIESFLFDPYYLGEIHLPSDENPGMWPAWREALVKDFDLGSKVHNLVITGSLGIGKTVMMTTLLLYRLYIATCLKNPAQFFGISKGSNEHAQGSLHSARASWNPPS